MKLVFVQMVGNRNQQAEVEAGFFARNPVSRGFPGSCAGVFSPKNPELFAIWLKANIIPAFPKQMSDRTSPSPHIQNFPIAGEAGKFPRENLKASAASGQTLNPVVNQMIF